MPVNTMTKRAFWFDDRKTPNVADVLEKKEDYTVFRLSFDGPEEENWAVMETCHAYCITSTRGEVPDAYKGTQGLIERCKNLLVVSTTGAGYDPVDVAAFTESGVIGQPGGGQCAGGGRTCGCHDAFSRQKNPSDGPLAAY